MLIRVYNEYDECAEEYQILSITAKETGKISILAREEKALKDLSGVFRVLDIVAEGEVFRGEFVGREGFQIIM